MAGRIGPWAIGGALAAVAVIPTSAYAEKRTVTVTLATGQVITVTVDVPDGTPLDKIVPPPIDTPIAGVDVTEEEEAAPDGPTAQPDPASPDPSQRSPRSGRSHRPARRRKARVPDRTVRPATRHKRPAAPRWTGTEPSPADPTFSLALPGPAPIGVPDFFIDRFRIPPFLLPIYQAAGIEYGVRWELLAAINEIETDYGRNVAVSSAGALGWMQFMPATWKRYGVDANEDGVRDPYNPVDAIFAAARYLKAAGAGTDVKRAIFAYNHADWYVDSVLVRARLIGGLPADLVGSLTGLTQGRFPVNSRARYAAGSTRTRRTATNIHADPGSPVVAVQDGRIVGLGRSARLGRYIRLRDAYGNTYTYSHLRSLAATYRSGDRPRARVTPPPAPTWTRPLGIRLPLSAVPGISRRDRTTVGRRPLRLRSRVVAGTVLGRIGQTSRRSDPHVRFQIRPAGRGAPLIDPKAILDGWKLLESTAIYRAAGRNPFFGPDARNPTIGQILLMGKEALERRVLEDRRIRIYPCGREDIRTGRIDRRVLATLAYLAGNGLEPTVTSLECGHGTHTASGNISEHASGNAVDISAINGLPVLGHQGADSITDITVRTLLALQGVMKAHQIITLMRYPGSDNTFAMADHADHIHIGFHPLFGDNAVLGRRLNAILKPGQWTDLIARLGTIENPSVPIAAPPVKQRGPA